MKELKRLEEVAMTLLSIYLIYSMKIGIPWWWYIPLFFIPDLSLVGITMKNKAGLFIYNLFHHKGVAVTVWIVGLYLGIIYLTLAGLILFGHSSFDRFLGFDLQIKTEL